VNVVGRSSLTTRHRRCVLSAISVELGELRSLDELPEFIKDPELLPLFRQRGLAYFAESRITAFELAMRSCRKTLSIANTAPGDIDTFILVTETQKADLLTSAAGMGLFLTEAGLSRAYPVGVHGAQCSNLAGALGIARALISTGEALRILVCVVEKIDTVAAPDGSRLTNEPGMQVSDAQQPTRLTGDLGLTVCSDGAASFLVSADADDGFEILSIARHSAPRIVGHLLRDQMQDVAMINASSVRSVVDEALAPLDLARQDVSRVLTNNCGMHIQKQILANAGFSLEQGFFDNIARFGHAFSVDNIANLYDLTAAAAPQQGERYLLLFNAASSWGAILLQRWGGRWHR